MTRTIGFVPVPLGRGLATVTVEAETGATTHVEVSFAGARIVVPDGLADDIVAITVEALLPLVQRQLAQKLLN